MKTSYMVAALLTVTLTVSSASTAQAQIGPGNGLGLSYLYGYQGFPAYSQTTYNRSQPYFALHPPVYYGKRYTRPYGVSPFAAWPQLQSSAGYQPSPHVNRVMLKPLVIENPCPTCSAEGNVRGGKVAISESRVPEPVIIDNPYFDPQVQYTAKETE